MTRSEIAVQILCSLINTGGGKAEKVAAAFEYADLVLFYETRPTVVKADDKRGSERQQRLQSELKG